MTEQYRTPSTLPPPDALAAPLGTAIDAGLDRLERVQSEVGSWRGDYGGPGFLLPVYVAVAHVVGIELDPETRAGIERYLRSTECPDGGWGLHPESHAYVFTSVLGYVALRLLGVPADDPDLARARQWIHDHGGPAASASWGKFFLCVLGLHEYSGVHPVPPELWLLPPELPFHPSRMWCHCRVVYLPMAWLYAARAQATLGPLTPALREELYPEGYAEVDWTRARERVAESDCYRPESSLLRMVNWVLLAHERHVSSSLRARAMDHVLDHIRQEDANTSFICLGPVNKLLHTLVWHFARPGGEELGRHLAQLPEYLSPWEQGIRMNGYNSSELWDTAFAVQAIVASGQAREWRAMLRQAFGFIERTQIQEDVPELERYYRHRSRGGWPFSTRAHGWPISDCTAEALKASLLLAAHVPEPLGEDRLIAALDLILSMQNGDGGWATYEPTRGPRWLELLNPSHCFGDIMIDYSYVECTSACVQALAALGPRLPASRTREVAAASRRGAKFVLSAQRPDGSWEGSWGICFTYGTWFGVWGLRAAGFPAVHPAIRRASDFLLAQQAGDGSWGETPESCRLRR